VGGSASSSYTTSWDTTLSMSRPHPRGRHKARVFRSRLGLTAGNADVLRIALLDAARNRQNDLRPTDIDESGQRYLLDFEMTVGPGTATIRSAWIVLAGETCYDL
jgi:hypothetical protein